MTQVTEADIRAGQAIYSSLMLKVYDFWVLSFSNSLIWRCSKHLQLDQFNQYVTNNHLDIGVGTGYYLKHTKWPESTKLSLMDLNPVCLAAAEKAAHFLAPSTYQADIFKSPEETLHNQFKSISMNFLLHCLPGDMTNKEEVIKNAVTMLQQGGVLFGATILSDDNLQTGLSRKLASFYNQKKIFSNTQDDYKSLKQALENNLERVEIKVIGAVALFKGYKSK